MQSKEKFGGFNSGVFVEWAKFYYIYGELFGTRTTTMIILNDNNSGEIIERTYF